MQISPVDAEISFA